VRAIDASRAGVGHRGIRILATATGRRSPPISRRKRSATELGSIRTSWRETRLDVLEFGWGVHTVVLMSSLAKSPQGATA
jgi:hypothetical protein